MSNIKLFLRCTNTYINLFCRKKVVNSTVARCASTKCISENENPITHTGQKWDKDDYRMVRFVDKKKTVNPNFAINLIEEVPPKACKERVVWCDGGSGPTGHPKVYINLDKPGCHACGYCGLRFYLDDHH